MSSSGGGGGQISCAPSMAVVEMINMGVTQRFFFCLFFLKELCIYLFIYTFNRITPPQGLVAPLLHGLCCAVA